MEKEKTRKPKWTEEQCLLLAQFNEHKSVLRGKCGPSVTVQAKKQAWETIAQQINASSEDREKWWYVLQSKAKEEIAAHKREFSHTGERRTTYLHLLAKLS